MCWLPLLISHFLLFYYSFQLKFKHRTNSSKYGSLHNNHSDVENSDNNSADRRSCQSNQSMESNLQQQNIQQNDEKKLDENAQGHTNQLICSSFVPYSAPETTLIADIPKYRTRNRNIFECNIKLNLNTPAFKMLWMLTLFIAVIILNTEKCSGGLMRYWILNGTICTLILVSTILAGILIHFNWEEREALGNSICTCL
jgi:hypothetical protein